MQFKQIDQTKTINEKEEEILNFWDKEEIFKKSIEIRNNDKLFSFYDGPPFATGTPHYGHILQSITKDVVPRYWTMKGYKVPRKWGWDCHGLPIENIVEKELGYTHKKEILELGVGKFNDICRSKVMEYASVWETVIRRMGRWADMENAYRTMDLNYMESVWWVFKELWDKGLVYESYRSMHICPRCETTLSQSEVTEGYKDIKDLSVIAKFELVDEPGTFVLAWTTTPWTLIGNVALAVGADIKYDKIEMATGEKYILAHDRLEIIKDEYKIISTTTGKDLVGKNYKPLFDYYTNDESIENRENGWKIVAGEFVTTEDGTGVVHIAPAFGEDDMNLGKANNLPFVQHLGMDGIIKAQAGEFAGLSVKPMDDVQKTDVAIIKYLAGKGLLFSKAQYEHSYPHCWRCDTPLLNYATSSWFVKVTDIKDDALRLARDINWSPKHIKEGRFGKWLEGARDWSISRQRFWASVIPLWRCECGEMKVIGSVKELEDLSGVKITDLHKDKIDPVTFNCAKCGKAMHRVADVLDTWFDSGSMAYAQLHYPFENEKEFEATFPADFIAEAQDQTRAWFYYLHILATALKNKIAYKNVVVSGIILAEDGKKMSKKLKNYPDPMLMFDKYGADAVRLYVLSSPVMAAENLNFSEKDLASLSSGMFRMLRNTYSFFLMYANLEGFQPSVNQKSEFRNSNVLDAWILSELEILNSNVDELMEKYELMKASRLFSDFIDNLSNWYLRRSRSRFKSGDEVDKNAAFETLYAVLVKLSKIMAPFAPFISEEIFKNLTGEQSVHLQDFPKANIDAINQKLNQDMKIVRDLVEKGLAARAEAKIRTRQPLASVTIKIEISAELADIMKDELNVKEILTDKNIDNQIILDTNLTPELEAEGEYRDLVRQVQDLRKKAGLSPADKIELFVNINFEKIAIIEKFKTDLVKETNLLSIENSDTQEGIWLGETK
jgi:isoleucyl-tRNA synthetase